jgi:phosphopantothenoylcysteine decarboxylase/phosphopantothenate--cysteine ligase
MPDADRPDLDRRRLLLGVTGSIAAYKAAALVREFKKAGAEVQVLMTDDAERFIPSLTLGTLSEREVLSDIFPENEEGRWTKHVTLGLWADLFVVAPATAQTIAKLAHGFSDNMLTATALSARCPVLVCPAMDRDMYQHPATQSNLDRLRTFDYAVMPAAHGELASGLVGQGRMPEPEAIVDRVARRLEGRPYAADREATDTASHSASDAASHSASDAASHSASDAASHSASDAASHSASDAASHSASDAASLAGTNVLVTAGPTQEPIDPVRMLTNPSTGAMGYALAEAAAERGGAVTLISGPSALDPPGGIEVVSVQTAEDMHRAVQQRRDTADLVLMAAAVADYTPASPSDTKQKKHEAEMTLHLRRTPDILRTLGSHKRPDQVLVGFALETDDELDNARRKLKRKNLDWIVLNNPTEQGAGFGPDTNRVTLLGADGSVESLPLLPKRAVADAILGRVCASHSQETADSPSAE